MRLILHYIADLRRGGSQRVVGVHNHDFFANLTDHQLEVLTDQARHRKHDARARFGRNPSIATVTLYCPTGNEGAA